MNTVWLGSEASYNNLIKLADQFHTNKEARSRSPYDYDDGHVATDPVFGVKEDRIGLYLLEKHGDKAVLKVHGSLTQSYSRWHTWFPGEVTSYEAIKDALQILAETGNNDVLMDMASGGGQVRGLSTVTDLMKRLRAGGMKIDAHSDSMSCSASYWLMSSARQVTASPMAEIGNIGTMCVVMTYANTEENMGVKFTVFKAGKLKGIGSPYEELDETAKKEIQANIEETNKFFLDHVSINRNLMLSDTDKWAEGRTFFAAKALEAGLIDKVTTLDDLIGSGASANNPSDNRRFEMQISAEKLAQIEAGADAKTVLTDAEYAEYTKMLAEAVDTEAQAKEAAEKAAKELEEAEAAKNAAKPAGDTLATDYREALKLNGKLEAQLEAAQAALTTAEANLAAAKAETASLLVVAQAGVAKLQVALQKPKMAESSPAAVVAQFNELQTEMAARFGTAQASKSTPVADTTAVQLDASYPNIRGKVAATKASR